MVFKKKRALKKKRETARFIYSNSCTKGSAATPNLCYPHLLALYEKALYTPGTHSGTLVNCPVPRTPKWDENKITKIWREITNNFFFARRRRRTRTDPKELKLMRIKKKKKKKRDGWFLDFLVEGGYCGGVANYELHCAFMVRFIIGYIGKLCVRWLGSKEYGFFYYDFVLLVLSGRVLCHWSLWDMKKKFCVF